MKSTDLLRKPYARMVLPDTDGTFTAEIVEFPGCVAVGATASEALANLEEVATDWISVTLEQGQDIPEPMDAAGYSGKLVVRMAKGLHKRASFWAARDGVSLNQFIVTCIAEAVGERAVTPRVQQTHTLQTSNLYLNIGGVMAVSDITYGQAGTQKVISSSGSGINIPFPKPQDHQYA